MKDVSDERYAHHLPKQQQVVISGTSLANPTFAPEHIFRPPGDRPAFLLVDPAGNLELAALSLVNLPHIRLGMTPG